MCLNKCHRLKLTLRYCIPGISEAKVANIEECKRLRAPLFRGRTGQKISYVPSKKRGRKSKGARLASEQGNRHETTGNYKSGMDAAFKALQMVAISDEVEVEIRKELMRHDGSGEGGQRE